MCAVHVVAMVSQNSDSLHFWFWYFMFESTYFLSLEKTIFKYYYSQFIHSLENYWSESVCRWMVNAKHASIEKTGVLFQFVCVDVQMWCDVIQTKEQSEWTLWICRDKYRKKICWDEKDRANGKIEQHRQQKRILSIEHWIGRICNLQYFIHKIQFLYRICRFIVPRFYIVCWRWFVRRFC